MNEETHEILMRFTATKLPDGRLHIVSPDVEGYDVVVAEGVAWLDRSSKPIQEFVSKEMEKRVAEMTEPGKIDFCVRTSVKFM